MFICVGCFTKYFTYTELPYGYLEQFKAFCLISAAPQSMLLQAVSIVTTVF